jgi:hypothetical protein
MEDYDEARVDTFAWEARIARGAQPSMKHPFRADKRSDALGSFLVETG